MIVAPKSLAGDPTLSIETGPPLVVWETTRLLRIARGGRLMPWLGPALRGLVGGRLRSHVCVLPVGEQLSTRKYCQGCVHMAGCAYGETVEPDPPAGTTIPPGWESAARPLVVAPAFPLPEFAQPGLTFPVRVVFIGSVAAGHREVFWDVLRVGGADPLLGLGDDHVLYDVLSPANASDATVTTEVRLPLGPGAATREAPRVRVEFSSPLFLNTSGADGDRRRAVEAPTFSDLIRAGLRVLGPLYRCYSWSLAEDVFGRVKAAAAGVPTVSARFHPFVQDRHSKRTGDRYAARGVTGEAVYGPVPGWLVPWLEWAGRVHVGTHRVAGAGGWVVR